MGPEEPDTGPDERGECSAMAIAGVAFFTSAAGAVIFKVTADQRAPHAVATTSWV